MCGLSAKQRLAVLNSGFALIELIKVIVILGVLAVVVVPRIFKDNGCCTQGFQDEKRAL